MIRTGNSSILPNGIIKRNKVEVIICVGDMGFVPEKSWRNVTLQFMNNNYKEYVDKICSYRLPFLTLRGDTYEWGGKKIADKILERHKNIINKFTGKYFLYNQNFLFFDLSFEPETLKPSNTGKHYLNKLRKNIRRTKNLNCLLNKNKNSILISHNPPFGYVDTISSGKHVGSKIVLNAIKKYPPKLVLCGHIHEAKGKAKVGKTVVYNLGSRGDYAVIETENCKVLESNFLK